MSELRGKKGKKCRNRHACLIRSVCVGGSAKYVSLPKPPDEWMVDRGYGIITDQYHAGGRWKSGGRSRLVCHLSEAKLRDAYQHYAYELAMGRAEVKDEALIAV